MATNESILPGMESELTANGRELAEWLCLTPAAVSQMVKAGKLKALPGGAVPIYPLKSSVQSVIKELRGRKRGTGEGKDLERSLKYWQVEKAKQAVLQWRLQYGKDIAVTILERLDSALAEFQRMTGSDARLNEAVLKLSGALKNARFDDTAYGLDDDDVDGGYDDDGFGKN